MRSALLLALSAALLACEERTYFPPPTPGPTPTPTPTPGLADAGQFDAAEPLPDAGQPPPGPGQCVTAEGLAGFFVRAYADRDGDNRAGTPAEVCVPPGRPLPAGYSSTPDDCNDADPGVSSPQAWYPDRDSDGAGEEPAEPLCSPVPPKGFFATATDCAPNDPKRWQLLTYAYRDEDSDGFTVLSSGTVCAGFSLPAGYSNLPNGLDCDDHDATAWTLKDAWFDGDGDGFGAGPKRSVCAGDSLPIPYAARGDDCDDTNRTRWQLLPYSFRNKDGDSYFVAESGSVCTGDYLPQGYSLGYSGLLDCDDYRSWVGPGEASYFDKDGDGVGDGPVEYLCSPRSGYVAKTGDCAPDDSIRWQMLSYWYRDVDLDGWTVSQSGSICSGAALPASYSSGYGKGDDCDDADETVHARVHGYADADRDGYGAGSSQSFCTAGELPAGYVTNNTDCAPEDETRWRTATNLMADRDSDGFTVPEAGSICIGEKLPPPYVSAANGNDCDDSNSTLWRWVVVYPDHDGDGVGAPPRQIMCLGESIPPGFSTAGWDSNDGDPGIQWNPAELDLVLAE